MDNAINFFSKSNKTNRTRSGDFEDGKKNKKFGSEGIKINLYENF
jgi:hypothetical protein